MSLVAALALMSRSARQGGQASKSRYAVVGLALLTALIEGILGVLRGVLLAV